jgi:peptidoglycan DL-endopeptidase CwlO
MCRYLTVGLSRVGARFVLVTLMVLFIVLAPFKASAEPAPADIERDAAAAGQRLEVVVEQYNTAREKLSATQAQLNALDGQLAPLAAQIDQLAQQVATIATSAYKAAGLGQVTALLSAGSPSSLLDQLTLLDRLAREDARDLATLRTARTQYDAQRAELETLAAQQAQQEAQLGNTKATIEAELSALKALRASSRAGRAAPRDGYVPVYSPDAAGVAVRFAYRQTGKEYRWGGEGPDAYDCSGLVLASWRAAGVALPHSSQMQWGAVAHIGRDQLQPGDLVFYYNDIHHVALYVGDGRMIHAPQEGERISMRPIDYQQIYGYGRVRR